MKKPLNKYNDLCLEERPEYKGASLGVNTLTNVELVSLVLNRGAGTYDSMHQARQMLNISGESLRELSKKRLDELEVVPGIGHCKALALMAALELGKRYASEEHRQTVDLGSATSIYNLLAPKLTDIDHEEMWLVFMNNNYKLISYERLSIGGITETAVDVRLIIRQAVLKNSTVIAMVHNHPSGSLRPSKDDDRLTERVRKACELMRMYLLDHLIISSSGYYSYRESGRL